MIKKFNKIIRARAPLRLGLAGGGTDIAEYFSIFGGYVLNATIARYTYATIKPATNHTIIFNASDINKKFSLQPSSIDDPLTTDLSLHQCVYKYMMENYNDGFYIPLELTTYCDSPLGSGLGTSSTLVVTMIQAYCELLGIQLDNYLIADLAYKIERIECHFGGGKQDQYSATFGGFNFIEFYKDRTIVNPLRINDRIINELEATTILYYTGASRESASIIDDQKKNFKSKDEHAIEAMHTIKNQATEMKESLLVGDMMRVEKAIELSWEAKRKSSTLVSNNMINNAFDRAIAAGAKTGKVSGAGGGGFILFFTPPENRKSTIEALSHLDGIVSNCHFTEKGVESWTMT